MQLKLGLIVIKLPKAPLNLFPENYVPPEVINKLTLSSQQKASEKRHAPSSSSLKRSIGEF